jgi:uncharacterized membrane protein YgcG
MSRLLIVAVFATIAGVSYAGERTPRQALRSVLAVVDFNQTPLSEVIDFLRDTTDANIHVNWSALEVVGVGKDAPVTMTLRTVPMRKALELALEEAGPGGILTYYSDEGVLHITTRELANRNLITRVYPVDDLVVEVPDFEAPQMSLQGSSTGGGSGGGSLFGGGGTAGSGSDGMTRDERAEQLVEMIMSTLEPDIWKENGGTATIRYFRGNLVVTAPRSVHERLGRSGD